MTTPKIEVGGAWAGLTSGQVYIGTSWRTITRAEYYDGSAWKLVATFIAPLTLSVAPAYDDAPGYNRHTTAITSPLITATPSGGLGPYTYLHSIVGYTNSAPTIFAPTSASTTVGSNVAPGDSNICDFSVTVTDSRGTGATATYTINFHNDYTLGGGF